MSNVSQDYQAVLLAGGLGTRIREETSNRPKPMIEIGNKPILWHLMKNLSSSGIRRFIVCSGYKSEVISDYFANYLVRNRDFTVRLSNENQLIIHSDLDVVDWEVTVVYTGNETVGTGGRIHRIKRYLDTFPFLCTYGDGLSDIQIPELFNFHRSHEKTATLTAINPTNRYGVLEIQGNRVQTFKEKPRVEGWINGGFFLFENQIFDYLDDYCTLENEPLQTLASEHNLYAYKHEGFWQSMDNFREYEILSGLWNSNNAPWKNW